MASVNLVTSDSDYRYSGNTQPSRSPELPPVLKSDVLKKQLYTDPPIKSVEGEAIQVQLKPELRLQASDPTRQQSPVNVAADVNRAAGVVQAVNEYFVLVQIQLSQQAEQIQLPATLVPMELRKFATPIWVELDKSEGYRRISVRPRTIERQIWHEKFDALEKEIAAV